MVRKFFLFILLRLENDVVKLSLGIGYESNDIPFLDTMSLSDHTVLRHLGGHVLTAASLSRLQQACWLNDEIINSVGHLINHQKTSKCYVMSTLFGPMVDRGDRLRECVRMFTKMIAPGTVVEKLMIPYHVEKQKHWVLGVIDFENGCLEYYDHYYPQTPALGEDRMVALVNCIRENDFSQFRQTKTRYKDVIDPGHYWPFIKVGNITKQTNTCDCGVFVCMDMYRVSQGIDQDVRLDEMKSMREKIYHVLMRKDPDLNILSLWTCLNLECSNTDNEPSSPE